MRLTRILAVTLLGLMMQFGATQAQPGDVATGSASGVRLCITVQGPATSDMDAAALLHALSHGDVRLLSVDSQQACVAQPPDPLPTPRSTPRPRVTEWAVFAEHAEQRFSGKGGRLMAKLENALNGNRLGKVKQRAATVRRWARHELAWLEGVSPEQCWADLYPKYAALVGSVDDFAVAARRWARTQRRADYQSLLQANRSVTRKMGRVASERNEIEWQVALDNC